MQKMKKSFLRLDALLLVAVLLLQGCKPDTTPDAFTFASQSKVTPDTLIESEPVTISGINIPAQLSITGGEYSIDGHRLPGQSRHGQERIRRSGSGSGPPSSHRARFRQR